MKTQTKEKCDHYPTILSSGGIASYLDVKSNKYHTYCCRCNKKISYDEGYAKIREEDKFPPHIWKNLQSSTKPKPKRTTFIEWLFGWY